jgi:aminoglycoside phosphotransferase (APT) family kinase protein
MLTAVTSAPAPSTDLRDRLARLLHAEIDGLHRLSGGASRETWSFDARFPDGSARPLILRRDPPGVPLPLGRVGGMPLEAILFATAERAGVPVPTIRASGDADDAVLETGFLVMDRVHGETIARKILRDEPYAHARSVLVSQLGQAAALLHAVAPESVPGLVPVHPLEKYREVLDLLGHHSPTFELAFRWLEAHRPAPIDPVIVHGDFRLGNVIVAPDGLAAVLDWELAHLGDPAEDLGWLSVRAWRFGSPHEVAGIGSIEDLLRAYHLANGHPEVDAARVHWWIVAGTLMWGVMCVSQGNAHTSGALPSVELAAIGRRVAEQEHDLLTLMGAPPAQPITVAPITPTLTAAESGDDVGFPSSRHLLDAVRGYLQRDVMTATDGRVAFHARVAQNVLAIVEREIALRPHLEAAQRGAATQLGYEGEAALADAIKNGRLDDRLPDALAALRRVVDVRVAIANPKHVA